MAALVLAAAVGGQTSAAEKPAAETAVTCTNPASGARWQIMIDYEQRTVDANPARVSDATISWHDAKDGGNYTLDRKSGALTMVAASSTGGFFLYHQCDLGKPG